MGTVDDLLAGLDPADRAPVAHLYAVAREVVPEAEQGLGYGMPALVYRGKPLISVMRAKKHIGVYPFSPDAVSAVAATTDARPPSRTVRRRNLPRRAGGWACACVPERRAGSVVPRVEPAPRPRTPAIARS